MPTSTRYKPFTLAFEERPHYLYARVDSNAISVERMEQYMGEIMDHCRELDCKCLLIDRHIPTTLSNVDVYRAITALSDRVPDGLRIALVDANSNNRKRLEFGSRAARAQRLDAQIFASIEDAEKWLLKD